MENEAVLGAEASEAVLRTDDMALGRSVEPAKDLWWGSWAPGKARIQGDVQPSFMVP